MSFLTPNFNTSEKDSSPGYHMSAETAAPMSLSTDFSIPTSVFTCTNNKDRIEFFDRFAIGDSRMNMKLVSEQGRDIPAFYSKTRGRKDGEIPLRVEWSGSERLEGVDKFTYDTAHDEIHLNGQTFTKLSPLRT